MAITNHARARTSASKIPIIRASAHPARDILHGSIGEPSFIKAVTDMSMTVMEFIEFEKETLERFARFWVEQKDPMNYPLEMPEGEWIEQFTTFTERFR